MGQISVGINNWMVTGIAHRSIKNPQCAGSARLSVSFQQWILDGNESDCLAPLTSTPRYLALHGCIDDFADVSASNKKDLSRPSTWRRAEQCRQFPYVGHKFQPSDRLDNLIDAG